MVREGSPQEALAAEVGALAPDLIAMRHELHRFPEVGWTEFATAAGVAQSLQALGWTVRLGAAVLDPTARLGVPDAALLDRAWQEALDRGLDREILEPMRGGLTGVVADLVHGDGPVLAFRFDLDALPVAEASGPEHRPRAEGWASTRPGAMHACGHDGHTAIGLGLARLLTKFRNHWSGGVRLIFQPAEEGGRGAYPMAQAGVVDDVDYLIGMHIGLDVPPGEVVAGSSGFLASTKLEVQFQGEAAHAGLRPEAGRSALLAAGAAALAMHSLAQHSGGISRVNVGSLQSGEGYNVVPPKAVLRVETRSDHPKINAYLEERVMAAAQGAAAMFGCQAGVAVAGRCTAVDSDPELSRLIAEAVGGVPGVDRVHLTLPFGASEDFTFLMERVHARGGRGAYVVVGAPLAAGHHHPAFDFPDSVLAVGLQILGQVGLRLLRGF